MIILAIGNISLGLNFRKYRHCVLHNYIYSCVSLLQSPNLWLIHIMVNIYREQKKFVKDCFNIPVDSASGHGQ